MNCTSCGRAHGPGARFCGGCGKPLAPCCPACGVEATPDAQFCEACGSALAALADAGVARKVVTIVFADLIGSTSLHERLDAESARRQMDRYYRALRGSVEQHGGTVVKLLGDGVMAAFGVPRVGEDDAFRAVRAAVGMQRAFRELGVHDLGLRVAVNTGEVVVSDDNADVVGDPVNVAARLQQEAADGDVLIGDSTRRLVGERVTLEPVGERSLRGRSETVAAYRVVSLERAAGAPATAFVGRGDELRRIGTAYEAAVATRRARLVVVLGSPGLGKSRLLHEFARGLGPQATVLTARCDAAGGATFAPLAEALRTFLRLGDAASGEGLRTAIEAALPESEPERARIATGIAGLLAATPAAPDETFFAVRRFLGALAATRPVVLAIDDLQWAEPLLLDLAEHLAQWSAGAPLLVLAAARPELRDVRAALATPGGLVSDVVTLAGLDAGAATRLAGNVIGADALPAAIAGRVLATSEGNPLFVSELVRMLVDSGALRREGDRWTTGVELAHVEMPPTIHAVLAARLERLPPEERTVLERGAVIGQQFSRGAVAHLLPWETTELDARLEALGRSELIERDAGWLFGEPALRFHHALIRDAAYRRLLKGTRAELHGRFADWLEARAGEAVEHEETIGWHLEQAHQYLRALGPVDEAGRALGERAARHLAAAGRRALARDDLPLAASLLGRALERLGADDSARAELALDWCEALLAAGEVGPAAGAIAELGRFAGASDRLRAWHTCFVGQRAVLTDPQALRATSEIVAAAAETLASVGDAAGEAKAHSVHASALVRLGKVGACEAALDRALAAARRGHDRRRANAVLAGAPLAALWGPSPVTRASGRCLDVVRVLRITQGIPAVEAVALRCQAVLEGLRGRGEAARRMIASSRQMVEELGITQRLLEADVFAGRIELIEGDAGAAERWLRPAYDGLRSLGLGIDAAQAAALLARAVLALGRVAEAEALSHESEALAGDDFQASIAWRGVRAEALARRGEHVAAVDLARAAVEIAAATDALLDHADARCALAVALRAAGRSDEADAEDARAFELWEAKGATLLAERARRDPARAAEPWRPSDDPAAARRAAERRVPTNAAMENIARVDAAVAARDTEAYTLLIADRVEFVHHSTGVVLDREGVLATWRMLLSAHDTTFVHEPLATLGDSLALCHWSLSHSGRPGDGFTFGPAEQEMVDVVEVDDHGRCTCVEFFAEHHLADAVARLYERYAELLPGGPAHVRAATTARAVAAFVQPIAVESIGAILAPGVEFVDHRTVGIGSSRGAEVFRRGLRSLLEATDEVATRIDDVIALRSDALLVRWTNFGTARAGGGTFERPFLMLWTYGADGLLTHMEEFELGREAEALARLDELVGVPPAARFANLAARSSEAFSRCWHARDWEGIVRLYVPRTRLIDRRSIIGVDLEGDDFWENLRNVFELGTSRWHSELLATRGERLALARVRLEIDDDTNGRSDLEYLRLGEVDAAGRRVLTVFFDLADLDAAYEDLDRRYAAGEGAPYAELLANQDAFRRAFAARDEEALRRLLPDDFTVVNHRRFTNVGSRIGRDEYLASLRSLDDLGVVGNVRLEHMPRLSRTAAVCVSTWRGSHDGNDFETPLVFVYEHDGRLFHSWEDYDLDQLDAALARFDELTAASRPPRIENAATRGADRIRDTWAARDWGAFAALFPPGFRVIDRRKLLHLEVGRDRYLEGVRLAFDMTSSRYSFEVLATRGDRLALIRECWEGSDGVIGPSEVPVVGVSEVDEAGEHVAWVAFDAEDLDAAYAELERRYDAGEAASSWRATLTRAFTEAFAARDWDTLTALLAPDLVVHDHRLLGWETLHGPAAYVQALRSLVELAPDTRLRIDHITMCGSAFLYGTTWVGSREGGPFEEPSVIVCVVDEVGRIRSFDQYDVGQLDAARTRFAAVGARP